VGRIPTILHAGTQFDRDGDLSQSSVHAGDNPPQLARGVKYCHDADELLKPETELLPTGRTTTRAEDVVNWTTTVDVDKVDVSCAFLGDDLCCRDKRSGFVSRYLDAKSRFGRVSPNEGPFFL
jgi:hypothetical protein